MIFFICLLGIVGIWFVALIILDRKTSFDYEAGFAINAAVLISGFVLIFFINMLSLDSHVGDRATLRIIDEKIDLYETRAENISNQLKFILVDEYSIHEMEIFNNMGGDGIQVLLIKYPELRASETFIEYTKNLQKLVDDVYTEKLTKLNIQRTVSQRIESPFTFDFIFSKRGFDFYN